MGSRAWVGVVVLLGCGTAPEVVAEAPQAAPVDRSAWQELAAMDTRTPVPLQPMMAWHQKQNMMAHLEAIEGITAGLATEDWPAVVAAAGTFGSSPQMAQQCEHMGAGAEGFTELALSFHRAADGIVVAAQAEDPGAVLAATAATLGVCTQCHGMYRQDVVDAAEWGVRTGSGHGGGHE